MVWSSIHVARPTSSFVSGAALASFSCAFTRKPYELTTHLRLQPDGEGQTGEHGGKQLAVTISGGGDGGGGGERERSGRRRWSSGPASGAMRRWREKAATVWRTGASGFQPGSGIEAPGDPELQAQSREGAG